ncbi:MAG: helix-turn-helix transcriptional regulator [Peptococcaceae bacterium]|nr:helix-turn-helix transcriptional regulator [Peptococcaceae bacterium]
MRLGESLAQARKKAGLTQEAVAEKLGVSRQTISKWETDETLPDIRQSKKLADLYQVTLDELVAFDFEVQELTEMIDRVSDEVVEKVDWTAVWAQKYPILARYPQEMDTTPYAEALRALLAQLQREQGYSEEDCFLVLKDILGSLWGTDSLQ